MIDCCTSSDNSMQRTALGAGRVAAPWDKSTSQGCHPKLAFGVLWRRVQGARLASRTRYRDASGEVLPLLSRRTPLGALQVGVLPEVPTMGFRTPSRTSGLEPSACPSHSVHCLKSLGPSGLPDRSGGTGPFQAFDLRYSLTARWA